MTLVTNRLLDRLADALLRWAGGTEPFATFADTPAVAERRSTPDTQPTYIGPERRRQTHTLAA